MDTVNVTLYLPPEIAQGLMTGEYTLNGSVVRDKAGRFVCFLQEAMTITETAPVAAKAAVSVANTATKAIVNTSKKESSLFHKAWHVIKEHPKIAATVVVGGTWYGIHRWLKYRKGKKAAVYIEHFNVALETYYNALMNGTLSESIVSDLIAAIDDMRTAIADGTAKKMEPSADQINNMLGILSYFTSEFAKANQYKYNEPAKPTHNDTCSNLRYIADYLKIQQKIYKAA